MRKLSLLSICICFVLLGILIFSPVPEVSACDACFNMPAQGDIVLSQSEPGETGVYLLLLSKDANTWYDVQGQDVSGHNLKKITMGPDKEKELVNGNYKVGIAPKFCVPCHDDVFLTIWYPIKT